MIGNFSHGPQEHSCPKRGVPGWANSQPVISDRKRSKTHSDQWLKTFVGSTNIYIIFATQPTSNWPLVYLLDIGTKPCGSGADHRRFISFPGKEIVNFSIFTSSRIYQNVTPAAFDPRRQNLTVNVRFHSINTYYENFVRDTRLFWYSPVLSKAIKIAGKLWVIVDCKLIPSLSN